MHKMQKEVERREEISVYSSSGALSFSSQKTKTLAVSLLIPHLLPITPCPSPIYAFCPSAALHTAIKVSALPLMDLKHAGYQSDNATKTPLQ